MYKCVCCGHLFEDGEEKKVVDMHGFTNGAGETFNVCPVCEGEYVEVDICPICNEWKEKEKMNNGVCDSCINNQAYNVDVCYKIGSCEKVDVELNGFLMSLFDVEDIEMILMSKIKKSAPIDCREFINEDLDSFAEGLVRLKEQGELN